ncbi:MAG TPA: alpha/beta fold hydrolase [Kofleriaceae bacterium]
MTRALLVAAVAFAAACGGATSAPAPGSAGSGGSAVANDHSAVANDHSAAPPASSDPADALALSIAQDFTHGDGAKVYPKLNEDGRKMLTAAQLDAAWTQVGAQLGPLKSSVITRRETTPDGKTIRVVTLTGERGAMDLRIAFDPGTQLVSTLRLLPAGGGGDPDVTAIAVGKEIADGKWDELVARFTGPMKAITKEQLASGYTSIAARVGAVKDVVIGSKLDLPGKPPVRFVYMQCEHGAIWAQVALDPTGKVAGLLLTDVAPAAYVDPSKFHEAPITVNAPPIDLPGTITIPNGKGPFPAVVLVHGSGPNDRDESLGENKPFRDLAEGLASRGIVVLRYEKRTRVHPAQTGPNLDDETILDALAAVALAEARPEVDPAHVYVVGHSLGAGLAPEIARRSKTAAGAVAMAAPGRPPEKILAAQMRFLGDPDGATKLEKEWADSEGKPDAIVANLPRKYWDDLKSHDGITEAKKLDKPLLVMHGDRDYQVTDEDFQLWKKALAGKKTVTFESFPGDDHPFLQGTGKPTNTEYFKPSHVDPAVIDKLSTWVLHRGRP